MLHFQQLWLVAGLALPQVLQMIYMGAMDPLPPLNTALRSEFERNHRRFAVYFSEP